MEGWGQALSARTWFGWNLLHDLHHRQLRICLYEAFCFQLLSSFSKPVGVKNGAALFSMIVAAEPDINVSRVPHTKAQILLASNF